MKAAKTNSPSLGLPPPAAPKMIPPVTTVISGNEM